MRHRVVSVAIVCLLVSAVSFAATRDIDPEMLAGMKARAIGPASMSGRTAAVDAVAADPDTIYIGAATGGVWKSTNGGLTWEPIFDDQPVAAIGAVTIFQPNPDIVWVGTGEGTPRNSVSVGNGVYRTLDAGRTWKHLGLEQTERISRILYDPSDSGTAYVCATGKAWGESEQRGVFRTTDGGATWKKVLYVDEKTGCADLAQDPSNPNKLIAAMWDYRRWPWFFRSGGAGSGLFVTIDGGDTWKRYTPEDGMPEGDLGRIGVAFSPSHPEIVYALVEAKDNVLLRSSDGGRSWARVDSKGNIGNRPFYFAEIHVDPEFPDRLYSLHSVVTVTDDGGKSFRTLVRFLGLHPDHHGMWIDPKDPKHIILANDGGVGISHDRGETWRFVGNLPLAQFYHVRVDNDVPYNIYGGLQDNGSWRGPSSVWESGLSRGIRNLHWRMVYFGDGFDTVPDPEDSMRGYAMSQGGHLSRYDLHTGETKTIRPDSPDGTRLRFNWNAGIAQDPFEPGTIYYGSQFVHKSTDRGGTWRVISGDLTTNNPEWQKQDESGGLTPDVTDAENFTTIVAIEPSPVKQGVIWVGTDDGRIHVTTDGGATWQSVEKNVARVPANTWVPHITASTFDAATAFAVFDNHRRSDLATYVYKTTDYGRSWSALSTDGVRGYALKLVQDPVDENLLFLGTEFGLYVSFDGGRGWAPFRQGVPTASVMDMAIQPRESDLVVATHGRGIYVVDDLRPLRRLSGAILGEPLHLFEIADARQHTTKQPPGDLIPGAGEFRGDNRPYGALISFSVHGEGIPHPNEKLERERKEAERASGAKAEGSAAKESKEADETDAKANSVEAEIRVSDAAGKVLRKWKTKVHQGINRVSWDLTRDAFKRPGAPSPFGELFGGGGPEVLPGEYTVTVEFRNEKASGPVRVLADPRFDIPRADREAKQAAVLRAGRGRETLAMAVDRIQRAKDDIGTIIAKLRQRDADADTTDDEKSPNKPIIKDGEKLKKALADAEKRLWQPPDVKGIPPETDALSKIDYVLGSLQSSWDAPSDAQKTYIRQAEDVLRAALDEANKLFDTDVAAYRARAREAGLDLLPETKAVVLE